MKTDSSALTHQLVPRRDLAPEDCIRMHALMETCYDHVSFSRFSEDLEEKDHALLLRDFSGEIQGFSTLALNPKGLNEAACDVLFSGDTVIHPDHWGGQELVRGFLRTAGSILATRRKPLIWYLLSKGRRTYMYLPLLFKRYYPALERSRHFAAGPALAAACSERLYPGDWRPDQGVIRFSEPHGQVNGMLAEDTRNRVAHPQVEFFLRLNPRFHEGDELVCLAELSPENLRGRAASLMRAGMDAASLARKEELCPA